MVSKNTASVYCLGLLCIQHQQTTYLGLFQRKAVSEEISNFTPLEKMQIFRLASTVFHGLTPLEKCKFSDYVKMTFL